MNGSGQNIRGSLLLTCRGCVGIAALLAILLASCRSIPPETASRTLPASILAEIPSDSLQLRPFAAGFGSVSDISIGALGAVFVADIQRHHVIRLDDTGSRIDSVGGRGAGGVQFDGPAYLDAGNELKIVVADRDNQRITMFDRRWQHLGYLDLRTERYIPGPLVQLQDGSIIFWDTEAQRLRKVRADAQPDSFFNPNVMTIQTNPSRIVYHSGLLYVLESDRGLFQRFTSEGRNVGVLDAGMSVTDAALFSGNLLLLTPHAVFVMRPSGELVHRYLLPHGHTFRRIAAQGQTIYLGTKTALYHVSHSSVPDHP